MDALEHLKYAVDHAADRRDAHAGFGAALLAANQFPQAAVEFKWLADREPDNAIVFFLLGSSLDRAGDCRGALAAFERFLTLADPATMKRNVDDVSLRAPQIRREIASGKCGKTPKDKDQDKGKDKGQ